MKKPALRCPLTLALVLLFIMTSTRGFTQALLSNSSPRVIIDFSASTPPSVGTSPPSAFQGRGFAPNSSTPGMLNSMAWESTGLSDGVLPFGGTRNFGDYALGPTASPVSTGGFYAYAGAPASVSNPTFLIQPASANFAPGTLTLRIRNAGVSAITSLAIAYNLFVRNDQDRSSSFDFSYSTDNVTYQSLHSFATPGVRDGAGMTGPFPSNALLPTNIPPGEYFYVRWSSADLPGSGARDEIGLDDIVIEGSFAPTHSLTISRFGNGTITSMPPNINCGTVCQGAFPVGQLVLLTAVPAEGSRFTGWSGSCSGIGSCSLIMDGDKTVTANFEEEVVGPLISLLSPADNATEVPVNADIRITFDRDIQKGNGSILIRRTSDDVVFQSIDVSSPSVSIADNVVSVASDFDQSSDYYIIVPAGAFKDISGDDFAGLPGTGDWNFSTGNAVDWCNLQFPFTAEGPVTVYAKVYEPAVTEAPGPGEGIKAWIGISPVNTNSDPDTWTTWIPAVFNVQIGNDDEYMATIGEGLPAGRYYYTSRFQIGSSGYRYGGTNDWFWDGITNLSGVLDITDASQTQTITFNSIDGRTYGDQPFVLDASASSGLPVDYVSSDPTIVSVSGTLATIHGAGVVTITATQEGDESFAAAEPVAQELVISKAQLDARADDKTITYGDPLGSFTISYSGFVNNDDAEDIDVRPLATSLPSTVDAGTYTISLEGGSDNNYTLRLFPGTLTINKAILVARADDKSQIYGDPMADFSISYTGFKGSDDAAGIDTPPSVVAPPPFSNAGSYVLALTGGMDNNYEFELIDGSLVIDKATLQVRADDKSKVYGNEVPPLTISYSGFKGADDEGSIDNPPVAETIAVSFSDAGSYEITVSGGADNNYVFAPLISGSLVIGKASLQVVAQDKRKTYGDPTPPLTVAFSGFKGTDDVDVLDSPPVAVTDATQFSDAGTYAITLTPGMDNNYSFDLLTNGKLIIDKAFLSAQAENKTKTYGDAVPELTVTYTGFVGSDDATVIDSRPQVLTTASEFSDAGVYSIHLEGGADNNYDIGLGEEAILTITRAPLTVAVSDASKVYGDVNPSFTLRYSGFRGSDDESELDVPPVASTTATQFSNVGDYPIRVENGTDNNYDVSAPADGMLTIIRAPLTVVAHDKTKVYGEINPELTFSYSGLRRAEDISGIDAPPSIACEATEISDAGTYPIVLAGGADDNYSFESLMNGILTVSKAMLIATADDKVKYFSDPMPEFTVTYTGFLPGQDVAWIDVPPTVVSTADEFSAPGDYSIVPANGQDTNYDFTYISGILTINEPSKKDLKHADFSFIVSPSNGSTNVDYVLTLTSNVIKKAKVYTFEVNTTSDFSLPADIVQSPSEEAQFTLMPGTRYYARVRTEYTDWSALITFVTGTPATLAYVVNPADGLMDVSHNATLYLNPVEGARLYTVELSTDPLFGGPALVAEASKPRVRFSGLSRGTTYFARVSTDVSPGTWGPTTSFTTRGLQARTRDQESSEYYDNTWEEDGIQYRLYPNPFNTEVTIFVETTVGMEVGLSIIDVTGKEVERISSFTNKPIVVARDIPKGMYFLNVTTPMSRKSIKLLKR